MAGLTQEKVDTSATQKPEILLDVQNLTTTIKLRRGSIRPVADVSFSVRHGEVLGLVGESGCGKSSTMLSIMRLMQKSITETGGAVHFDGRDLLKLKQSEMRAIRGRDISMVFQEPMTALDPAFSIGYQIIETIKAHRGISQTGAGKMAVDILERVGIPNAARRMNDYPHQFSGGMRQRVILAIALVMKPRLLVADEPTSALDVTIQAQILDLLRELKDEMNMSVILITHDLGVVYEIADRIAVMYAGEIVEIGSVQEIFENPQHPYTQGLLDCMPDLSTERHELQVIPGRVPELTQLPQGCWFAPRCENQIPGCLDSHPLLERQDNGYALRCINPSPYK